ILRSAHASVDVLDDGPAPRSCEPPQLLQLILRLLVQGADSRVYGGPHASTSKATTCSPRAASPAGPVPASRRGAVKDGKSFGVMVPPEGGPTGCARMIDGRPSAGDSVDVLRDVPRVRSTRTSRLSDLFCDIRTSPTHRSVLDARDARRRAAP